MSARGAMPCLHNMATWGCETEDSIKLRAPAPPPHPPSRGQHLQGSVAEDQSSLSFVEQPLATVLPRQRVSSLRLLYPLGFMMMGKCNPSGY